MTTETLTDIGSLLVVKDGYRQGWPCLRGTGITVHNVSVAHNKGMTIEQLWEQNPQLNRALFYAALAYYYANKERVDRELDEESEWGEALRKRFPNDINETTVLPPDFP